MSESTFVVAQLNARLQPMHRGELFEDPLIEEGIEVSGGGALQSRSGEIEYCDIEIELTERSDETIERIIQILERCGAPKGSKLHIEAEDRHIELGRAEGIAVYLNGTDLPDETYAQCDSNFVYDEFDRLLEGIGRVFSYWQGPTETAFYMYGSSYTSMRERLEPFLATYPLCARCRVEQIA